MDRLIGVFLVTLSAILFGTNPILARMSYDAGANPATYLFIRFLIASPIMFLIMMARGDAIPRGKLLFSLILIGGIAAGTTFCFYSAIRLAPVNLIIVITYMYPTMVTLLSAVFLKQAITAFKIAALFMTVVGILFAIGMDSGGYVLGITLAIVAAIFHSLFLILGSLSIQKAGPFPASTIIILSFEVVVADALAIIILGETLSLPKILGACLVILAVVILAKSEYKTAQVKISHSISR